MTDEREPGKPLDNARHERFAQGVASGMSATGAYEDAGYQPDAGNASHLTANHKVSERIQELLDTMQRDAIDLHHVTKEVIIGGLMQIACHGKSEGARVAAWKLIGQANVIGLFVGDDENAKPKTAPEIARIIAGDNDELYRMILTQVPLAPSEKQ